jgi:hypothetical protein
MQPGGARTTEQTDISGPFLAQFLFQGCRAFFQILNMSGGLLQSFDEAKAIKNIEPWILLVRRQSCWDRWQLKIRESLARLVCDSAGLAILVTKPTRG